jgi:preprotein translocase subunit SecE
MGRILRKKPASLKKRKKQDSEKPLGESTDHQAAANAKSALVAGQATTFAEKRQLAPVLKKAAISSPPPAASAPADTMFTRALQFLREVKTELKKVTWPTRKQAMGSTVVVIVLVIIISVFLGIVDLGLSTIVRAVFN